MKLRISHSTTYSYDSPVSYGLQQVRLTPTNTSQQKVLSWSVAVEGGKEELQFTDHYGNRTLLISVLPSATEIRLTAAGEVETSDPTGVLGKVYGMAPLWHFQQETDRTVPGDRIKALAKGIETGQGALSSLHDLSKKILEDVPYKTGMTAAATTAEEALRGDGGVCQDHAQILISAAREAGLPARYVSGYLMMNDRVDQDASHAWAEVHIDALGWVGFDVSNGISPDERYVRIATGRDSSDASPISGMRRGAGGETMIVSLQVQQ